MNLTRDEDSSPNVNTTSKTRARKNMYWGIYMTECSTFRYVQKLLETRSTVFVQLDQEFWKKYRTFQKYLAKATRKTIMFGSCLFFTYLFIDFYYKLYYYTLLLRIAEHNIGITAVEISGHNRIYYTDKNSLIFQGYVVDRCPTLRQ